LGDVNADGYDDVLIGAYENDDGGTDAGKAYLVLGKSIGWTTNVGLGLADASFIGEMPEDYAGILLGRAGDVNSDGFADFLISAPGNDDGGNYAGQAYLIFGKPTGWVVDQDLASSDASFIGEFQGDQLRGVSDAGDVDGDGFDDILLGSINNDEAAESAGQIYLVLGAESGWQMDTNSGLADASYLGENALDGAGGRLAAAGDVNGDGFGDFLVGAHFNGEVAEGAGKAYLLLGRPAGWTMDSSLADADASFLGEAEGDLAGISLAGVGDVNSDGYDDILIGAQYNDEADFMAGQAYLIFGRPVGWTVDLPLQLSDASFVGEDAVDVAGCSSGGLGDINGDGHLDAFVSARGASTTYVVTGRTSGWSMDSPLADSPAAHAGSGWAGWSADGTGDVNGDGFSDLVVGAPDNGPSGLVYLVFGSCWDADGDGVDGCAGDCDDMDGANFPGNVENCDGHDNDCDEGTDENVDGDGDGYTACENDCDDTDPAAFPGNPEVCDGIDNDCHQQLPLDEMDQDGDGWMTCEGDCDDGDEELNLDDQDGDGSTSCDGDCDDLEPDAFLGNAETCDDGIDNDCDGAVDLDDEDCEEPGDDDTGDDDTTADDDDDSTGDDDSTSDDDTGDDDTTGPPGDDCDCRSQTAPGAPGSLVVLLIALVGIMRRGRESARWPGRVADE